MTAVVSWSDFERTSNLSELFGRLKSELQFKE